MSYPSEIIKAFMLLAAILLSARLWGGAALRWMRCHGEGAERHLLAVALGLGIISYSIFGLAAVRLLWPVSIWAILVLSLPAAIIGRIFFSAADASAPANCETARLPLSGVLFLSAVGLLFVFNLFNALAPPYAGDALGYHLPAVRSYLAAHRLVWLPGNVLANQPAAVDMLFAVGFAGQSELFPQLLHCSLGLLTALAVYSFGRRWFGRSAAALGSLIFYSVPSVSVVSSWAYIDLGLALWTVLAVFCYLRWRDGMISDSVGGASCPDPVRLGSRRDPSTSSGQAAAPTMVREAAPRPGTIYLLMAAVFSGLAMGSKYTGLIAAALLWSLVLLEASQRGRGAFRAPVVAALFAAVLASPWYLKNLFLAGNPFYPFLFSIFGGRGWDAVRDVDYRTILLGYGMGKDALSYLLLPWNLSVRADFAYGRFDGILGPAFLLLPLGFFSGRQNPVFRFLAWFCLAFFVIWSFLSQQVRMLIPVLPLAGLLVGAAIVHLWERRPAAIPAGPDRGRMPLPQGNETDRLWADCGSDIPACPDYPQMHAEIGVAIQAGQDPIGEGSPTDRIALILVLSAILAMNAVAIGKEAIRNATWKVILGLETRNQFLSRQVYNYPAVDFINRRLPPGSRVLFVYGGNAWYYAERPTAVDSIFQDHTFLRLIRSSSSGADLALLLKKEGITHVLINTRLFAEGASPGLSSSEKDRVRVFRAEKTEILFRDGDNLVLGIR